MLIGAVPVNGSIRVKIGPDCVFILGKNRFSELLNIHLFLLQLLCPCGLFESHQDEILPHQQRALDQHSVRGQ